MSENPNNKRAQERSTSSKYRRSDTSWTVSKRSPTRKRVFPPKSFRPSHRRAMASHSDSTLESTTRMSPWDSLTSSSDILLDSSKNISDLPLSSLSSEHQASANRPSRNEPKCNAVSRLRETSTWERQGKQAVHDEVLGKVEADQGEDKMRTLARGERMARCRGDTGKLTKCPPLALLRTNSKLSREKTGCEKKTDDVRSGDCREKQKQNNTSLRRIGIRVSSLDGLRKRMECKKPEAAQIDAGRFHSEVEISKSQKDTNECKNQIDDSLQHSPCHKLYEAPNIATRRTCDSHISGLRHVAVEATNKTGVSTDKKLIRNMFSEPKPLVKLKGIGHQNPMSLANKMSKEVTPESQPMLEVRYNAPTMWTNTHSETAAPQNVLIKKKLFKFLVKKPTQLVNPKPSKAADIDTKCLHPPFQMKELSNSSIQKPSIDISTKKLSACSDHKSKCDESKSDIRKIQNNHLLQRAHPYPHMPTTPSPKPEIAVEGNVTTNKDFTVPIDSYSGKTDNSNVSTMDMCATSRGKPYCLAPINKPLDMGNVNKPIAHAPLKNSAPQIQSNCFKKVASSTEANPVSKMDTDTQAEMVSVPSIARKSLNDVSEKNQSLASSSFRPTTNCETNRKANDRTSTSVSVSEKYPKPDRWRAIQMSNAAAMQNTTLDGGVTGQRAKVNDTLDAKVKNKVKTRNSSAPPSDQRAVPTNQHLEDSKTAVVNKDLKWAKSHKDPTLGRSPPKLKEQPVTASEGCPNSAKKCVNDTKHVKEVPSSNLARGKPQANVNNRKKCCPTKNVQLFSDYPSNDDAIRPVSERRAIQKPNPVSKDVRNNNLKIETGVVSSSKTVKQPKPSNYEASPGSFSEARVATYNETSLPTTTDGSVTKKQVDLLHRSRSWDQSSKKSVDDDEEREIGENRRGIHSKINSEINEIVEVVMEFLTKRKEMSAQRSPELNRECLPTFVANSSPSNSGEPVGDQPMQSLPTDVGQLPSVTSSELGQADTTSPEEVAQQAHKFESIRTYFESQVNRIEAFRKDSKYSGYSSHRNYLRNMKSPTSEPRLDTLDVTSESPVEKKRSGTSRNSKSACIQSPTSLAVTSNTTYSDNYEALSRLQKLRALVPNEQGNQVEVLKQPIPSARKSPIDKSFTKRRMRIGQILKSKFEHNLHPRNSSCDRSRSKSTVYLSGSDTSVSQASTSFTLKSNKSHKRDPRHEEINREKEKISCRCAAIHSILNDLKHHILLERVGQQMYTPAQLPNYDDTRLEEREFNESGKVGRTESNYSKASTSEGVSHYSREKNAAVNTSGRPLPKPRCRIPRFVPSGNQSKNTLPLADISCDSDYLKIIASIIKNNAILSDEQHPNQSGFDMEICSDHDRKFRSKQWESKSFIEHFCKQLVESWQLGQDETWPTNCEQQSYLTQERLGRTPRTSTNLDKKGGEKIDAFERNEKYHLGQGEIQDFDEMNSLAMFNFLPGAWMKFSRSLPDFSKIFGHKSPWSIELKEAQGQIGNIYKETITAHGQAKNTLLEYQIKSLKQREEKYATENRKSEKKTDSSKQRTLNYDEMRNKSIRELLEFAYSQKNNEDISKQIVREIYDRASRKQSDVKYKKQLREGALQLFCLLTSQSVSEKTRNLEQELFDDDVENEEDQRCKYTLEKSTEVSHVEETVEKTPNQQDAYTIMKAEYVERIKENQRIIDQWSLSPSNKYPTEDVDRTKETILNAKVFQLIPVGENVTKVEACIDEATIREVKIKRSSKKGVTFVLPSFTAVINDDKDTPSGGSENKIADAKSPPNETHQGGVVNDGPQKDGTNHSGINDEIADKHKDTPRCDAADPSAHCETMKAMHPENNKPLSRKADVHPTDAHPNLESPTIREDMHKSHLCGDRGTGHASTSLRGPQICGKSETKRSCENDVPEPLEYVPKSYRSPEISPETGHSKLSSPKREDVLSTAASTKSDQNKLPDKLTECRSCKTMYKSRLNDEGSALTKESLNENGTGRSSFIVDEKNSKYSPHDQDGGGAFKEQPLLSPKIIPRRDLDQMSPDPLKDQCVMPPVRNRRFVEISRSPETKKKPREASPYAEKKFTSGMGTLLETHTEDEDVSSECAGADIKLSGAYKPVSTSSKGKNPTGFSPLNVAKPSEIMHEREVSNVQKPKIPERNVENKAGHVKHAGNKSAADNHDSQILDGKVVLVSHAHYKTNEHKCQIDTHAESTAPSRSETPAVFQTCGDKLERGDCGVDNYNNHDAVKLPDEKVLNSDDKRQDTQISSNIEDDVLEKNQSKPSLKSGRDSKIKEVGGSGAEDSLEKFVHKNVRNEIHVGEPLKNSADNKLLPSDENRDKNADESTYSLQSEELYNKTLCETVVLEKTSRCNNNIESGGQKENFDNSTHAHAVNIGEKLSPVHDKTSFDANLTRRVMNMNSSKEELVEDMSEVRDTQTSAGKIGEPNAANKDQLFGTIKIQDKCEAFFCGAEASKVDSSKGIDELLESEIKLVANNREDREFLSQQQIDKASGATAQDIYDVGTEMSQLSECKYVRNKKIGSITQKAVDKSFDVDLQTETEDTVKIKNLTKEPVENADKTVAVLTLSEKHTPSKQTINLKTVNPIKGYNYIRPDNLTFILAGTRNQVLSHLSGSKSQHLSEIRKQSQNLNEPTNAFSNITKSRSKTWSQLDLRNYAQETAVVKIQAVDPGDPRKQSWDPKVSENQTLNFVLPKNKPFNLVDPLNQPLDLSDQRNLPLNLSGRQFQVLDLSRPRSHQVTRKDSIYEALDLSDPRKHKLKSTGSMYKLYNQVEPLNLALRQAFNPPNPGNQFMSLNDSRFQAFNYHDLNNQIFAVNDPVIPVLNLNYPQYQASYPADLRYPMSNMTSLRSENTVMGASILNAASPCNQANNIQSAARMPISNLEISISPNLQNAALETSSRNNCNFVLQGDFPFRCPVFNYKNNLEVINVQENEHEAPSEVAYQTVNKTNLIKPIVYGNPQNHTPFNQVNYPSPLYQTSPLNMNVLLNQQYPVGSYQPRSQENFVNQAFLKGRSQPQAESNFISQASLMNYLQAQSQGPPVNKSQRRAEANFVNQGVSVNHQQHQSTAMFLNQVPHMNRSHTQAQVVPPSTITKHSQPPSSQYIVCETQPMGQLNNPGHPTLYNSIMYYAQPLMQASSLENQVNALGNGSLVFDAPHSPNSVVSSSHSLKHPQNSANNASQNVDIKTSVVKRDSTKSNTELNACNTPLENTGVTKLKCQSAPSHFTDCTNPNNTLSESCVVNQDIHKDKSDSLNQKSAMQLSNQTTVPITSSSVGYEACSKPNSVKFSDPLISYASHAPTSLNADSKIERSNHREFSNTSVCSHHFQDQSLANSQQHRMFDSECTCEAWQAADTFSYTQETIGYDNEYLMSDLSRFENSDFSKIADMTTQVSRSHLYVATQMSSTDTIHSLPMTCKPGEVDTGRGCCWQSFDNVDASSPSQLASSSSALYNHQVSYSIAVECLIQNDTAEIPKRVMTPIKKNEMSEGEANSASICENKRYCGSRTNPNIVIKPYSNDVHPMYDPRGLGNQYAMDNPNRWEYQETLFDISCANDSASADSHSSLDKQAHGPSALKRSASDCISQIPKDTSVNDVFEYPIPYNSRANYPICLNEIHNLQRHRNYPTPEKRMEPSSTLVQSTEASNLRYATVFGGGTPAEESPSTRDPIRKMPRINSDGLGSRRSMFNRPLAYVRPEEPLDLSDTAQDVNSTVRNSSLNTEPGVKPNDIPAGTLPSLAVNPAMEFAENNFYGGKKKGVCNPYTLDLMAQTRQLFSQSAYKTNNSTPTGYEPQGFVTQAKQHDTKNNESCQAQTVRVPQYPEHYNPKDVFNTERVYNRVTDCMRTNVDQFAVGQSQDKRFKNASETSNKTDERYRQYSAPSEHKNSSNIDTTNCFRESPSDNLQDFPVNLRSTPCGSERVKNFRASSPIKSLKTNRSVAKPQRRLPDSKKRLFPFASFSWNGSENKNASQQYERWELLVARDNVNFGRRINRSDTGKLGKASKNILSKNRHINPHVARADVCVDLSSKLDQQEMLSANFSMDVSLGLRMEDFYAIEDDNYPILSCYSSIASIEGVSGSSSDMTIKSSFHSDADLSSSGEVSRAFPRSSPDRKLRHVHQLSTCTITDSTSVSESFHSCSSRLSFT